MPPAGTRKTTTTATTKAKAAASLRQRYRRVGLAGSLAGASKLRTALGRAAATETVMKALAGEESYTLHRPVRYRFPRQKTIVSGPGEQLQCDLVDCSEYQEANGGTRYLFCCIDAFSRYAWARPLLSKRGTETTGAMAAILDEMGEPPLAVQSDKGTEMRAAPFQRLLKSRTVHFFTSENDDIKCAIVERFQRTLQGMIHRHMTANRTRRFVHVLPALLRTYNATHHSAIGMAPRDVDWSNAEHVWERLYARRRRRRRRPPRPSAGPRDHRLRPGDSVRMSKTRRQFAKGYTGHWSQEIFRVDAVRDTVPVTYVVSDLAGERIRGTFYGPELQKVTPPDYYDIETILDTRRRGGKTQYLVKWKGYPASFNSWESDVVRLPAAGVATGPVTDQGPRAPRRRRRRGAPS